jgi:hypothetical protein
VQFLRRKKDYEDEKWIKRITASERNFDEINRRIFLRFLNNIWKNYMTQPLSLFFPLIQMNWNTSAINPHMNGSLHVNVLSNFLCPTLNSQIFRSPSKRVFNESLLFSFLFFC